METTKQFDNLTWADQTN